MIHPRKQLYQLTKIEAGSVPLFPGEDCAVRLEIDGVIAGVDVRAAEIGLQARPVSVDYGKMVGLLASLRRCLGDGQIAH